MAAWSKCETGPQPTGHALFHWQVWTFVLDESSVWNSLTKIILIVSCIHNIKLVSTIWLGIFWKLQVLRRTESNKQLSVFLGKWELPKISEGYLRSPYQVWCFILHQRFHRRFREMLFDDAEPTTPGPFSFEEFRGPSFGWKQKKRVKFKDGRKPRRNFEMLEMFHQHLKERERERHWL